MFPACFQEQRTGHPIYFTNKNGKVRAFMKNMTLQQKL